MNEYRAHIKLEWLSEQTIEVKMCIDVKLVNEHEK